MEMKILHLKNCIAELLVFLIYIMVEQVFFIMMNGDRPGFFQLSLPFAIPLFYYLVRCRVRRFWLFALFHILPPAVLSIVYIYREEVIYAVVFALAALIQAFLSLNIRIKFVTDQEQFDYGYSALPPGGILGLGLTLFLISRADALFYPVLLYLAVYFIYMYLRHFLHYIDMNKIITGHIPEKSIFTVNFSFVGGFTAISVLLIIFFADVDFFASVLRSFIRWLGSLVRFLMAPFSSDAPEPMESLPQLLPEADNMSIEPSSTPLWAEILEIIMTVICIAFLLALAAVAVYLMVKLIRRVFSSHIAEKASDGDEIIKDVVEKLERKEIIKAAGSISLIQSPEEKIRRIFRKVLQKYSKTNPAPEAKRLLGYGTARECLSFLHTNNSDAALLANIYEKARYGYEPCTASDVREAKRLARSLADTGR